MNERVLILGSGAREHALAWRLAKDGAELHIAPGNGGTLAFENHALDLANLQATKELARKLDPALIVVGPEAPLVAGAVDLLEGSGFSVFGPRREAARLEGSKAYAKSLMEKLGIPTAQSRTFHELEQALAYVRSSDAPLVLKADGLAAGKGVLMTRSPQEAEDGLRELMSERRFGNAGDVVVIEETLIGPEVSFHVLCDGTSALPLDTAQDHKRLLDGGVGPNTGGMGSFSPSPHVSRREREEILRVIVRPLLAEMERRGAPFRGVLFVGLMMTSVGPKVLEFNVRFGDPETQSLMVRLAGNFFETLRACATGTLVANAMGLGAGASATLVLASKGYPASGPRDLEIRGIAGAEAMGAQVFHAGTRVDGTRLVTAGGRVLSVTASGDSVREARKVAYLAAAEIEFEGMQYRTDIGA